MRFEFSRGHTRHVRVSEGARGLRITTRRDLPLTLEESWRLLCDSRLEQAPRCPIFWAGVPRPRECVLPDGEGDVGASRECRSDQGTVHQRITVWEPPSRLRFHMESTDLSFRRHVDGLADEFHLSAHGAGTRVTRTTTAIAHGPFKTARYAALAIGLKAVHRHVFRNWQTPPAS